MCLRLREPSPDFYVDPRKSSIILQEPRNCERKYIFLKHADRTLNLKLSILEQILACFNNWYTVDARFSRMETVKVLFMRCLSYTLSKIGKAEIVLKSKQVQAVRDILCMMGALKRNV